jgi:hypothetical protein
MRKAIILCLVGAGLALYAATRTWAVDVTVRPAPLPDLRTPHDGGPWLSALAVVGLAGAGAVVATRGQVRRAVGVLLTIVGLALTVGGAIGLRDSGGWPTLCMIGGIAVVAAGGMTITRAGTWSTLGARYDRDRPVPAAQDGSVTSDQAWDALDRGEDPTVR